MAEYIDRDYVLKLLGVFNDRVHGDYHFMNGIETAKEIVEDAPSADVQPVKHAAWDYAMPVDGPERNRYRCSRCSGFALLDYWGNDVRSRYCPECGAIMDDEGKKYWVHYDGELTPAEG